jgi:2-phosphosulfolactate phosphatase
LLAPSDIAIVQGRTPDLPDADVYVVIDVLRAFTTTHVALRRGASDILLARDVEEARQLARTHPDRLLAGERDARPPSDFDTGNSPFEMGRLDLEGRGLVLTTTNGVRATTHAFGAGDVVVTGWSNVLGTMSWLARSIQSDELERLVLVASHPVSDEDLACAEFVESRLLGRTTPTVGTLLDRMRRARSAQKFQVTETWRDEDLDIALQRHPPEMAMIVESRAGTPVLVPHVLA